MRLRCLTAITRRSPGDIPFHNLCCIQRDLQSSELYQHAVPLLAQDTVLCKGLITSAFILTLAGGNSGYTL